MPVKKEKELDKGPSIGHERELGMSLAVRPQIRGEEPVRGS